MILLFHPGDLSAWEWLILLGILVLALVLVGTFIASVVYITKFWVRSK